MPIKIYQGIFGECLVNAGNRKNDPFYPKYENSLSFRVLVQCVSL
jgi:hypothetical protein